jgi:hypothetical protein
VYRKEKKRTPNRHPQPDNGVAEAQAIHVHSMASGGKGSKSRMALAESSQRQFGIQ